ncbi:MAG TPA: V-type ATP synthase subunit F [Nitrospirales bacterium]|nr:V-type ATP synthase subunit F [Nitrospirales bacterium]
MKIVVIGPEALRLGYESGGAEFVSTDTPQEALQQVLESSSKEGVGMLLIASMFAQPIQTDIDRIRATRPLPLILEIPDFEKKPREQSEWLSSIAAIFGIKVS